MSAYRVLNIILAGVIGMVFLYSGFFVSTDISITCGYKAQFGIECVSCGFSRDFAAYTHFDFGDKINEYSGGLFLFFLIQFIGRLFLFFKQTLKESKIAKWDGVLSGILFLILVGPYLIAYFEFIVELSKLGN